MTAPWHPKSCLQRALLWKHPDIRTPAVRGRCLAAIASEREVLPPGGATWRGPCQLGATGRVMPKDERIFLETLLILFICFSTFFENAENKCYPMVSGPIF